MSGSEQRFIFKDLSFAVPQGKGAEPLDRVLRAQHPGASWAEVRRLIETGKVNALFVINQTRLKQLPNVPTTQELGVGYERLKDQVTTIFLMAPAGTPKPVLDRLNAALNQAHKDPAVISALDALALIAPPPDISLDTARTMAAAQIDAWSGAVKAVGKF